MAGSRPSAQASLSREVVEEILLHSSRSEEGEQLSDRALAEIALCANLDPARVLDMHRRLCDAAEQNDVTVLRVVEIWEPEE